MADELDRLFRSKHRLEARGIAALEPRAREQALAVARGATESRFRLRAIEVLARDAPEHALELFEGLLRGGREPPEIRTAAARQLGLMGGERSEALLVEALAAEENPVVEAKLAAALARTASAHAIGALADRARTAQPFVRRMLEFAVTVIAHRHGVADHRLQPPKRSALVEDDRAMRRIAVVPAEAGEIRRVATLLDGDDFGIAIAPYSGSRLRCGPTDYTVLMNAEPLGDGWVQWVLQRPALLAIVAGRAQEDGDYSVSRLVLAGPFKRDCAYLAVYRTDGTLVHWGTVRGNGECAEFVVQSVRARGNVALRLSGQIEDGLIQIKDAAAGTHTMSGSSPAPFTPPV